MMRDPYHEPILLVGFLWEWEWGVVWVAAGPTSLGVFVGFPSDLGSPKPIFVLGWGVVEFFFVPPNHPTLTIGSRFKRNTLYYKGTSLKALCSFTIFFCANGVADLDVTSLCGLQSNNGESSLKVQILIIQVNCTLNFGSLSSNGERNTWIAHESWGDFLLSLYQVGCWTSLVSCCSSSFHWFHPVSGQKRRRHGTGRLRYASRLILFEKWEMIGL